MSDVIEQAGRPGNWRDLTRLDKNTEIASIGRPEHVGAFFADLATDLVPDRVLDPFAISPVVASAVAEVLPAAVTTALTPSERSLEIGQAIAPSVEWRSDSLLALASALDGAFDLVVCSPPIGLHLSPSETAGAELAVPEAIWRRNAAHLMLCLAAERLAPAGKLAFLLGQGSLPGEGGKAMHEYLGEMGIGLEASVSFREGLAPLTYVETQVAVYSREAGRRLFVARVTPRGPRKAIVDNLAAGKAGPEMELGFFADRDRYRGWERARAEQELESLLEASPATATIGSLARIARLRAKREDPEPSFENTVYLPEVGTGPARLQIDWSGDGETRGIVALILDPERAEAGYVAEWLNRKPGKIARRLIVSETVVPRTRLEDLEALRIPLPPIELQRRSVRLRRLMVGVQAELEVLGERVATDASELSLDGAERDLGRLLEGDDIESWARRLPFPVASILARSLAAADPDSQFERLLFFFEAFAAFLAILLLSGARMNEQTWQRAGGTLARSGRGARHLKRATFGGWIWIGLTLAEYFRDEFGGDALQADATGAEARTAAVGVEDQELYAALLNEEVWSLLDRAKTVRNRQKGHGGAISTTQLRARVRELEQLLGELHQYANRAFDRVVLVQPGIAGFDGSTYRFLQAKRLIGPSGIFAEQQMTTVFPLREDALFLVDRRDHVESVVEILPLVHMLPSPDTEESVCYFYNGLEEDRDLRYVSYHLPLTESIPLDGSSVGDLIDELS